jgi:hypothetical protein
MPAKAVQRLLEIEEVVKGDSATSGGGSAWKELAMKPSVRHVLVIVPTLHFF